MSPIRSASARARQRRPQRGVMLLEALIAILIFSIGILGIVGLQATAVQQSTDARYRAEAAELVQELLGQMWAGNRTAATLATTYNQGAGVTCTATACQNWVNKVKATLPGVTGTSMLPTINVDTSGGVSTGIVTISVFWRAPSDDPSTPAHRYDTESQIGQ